MKIFKLSVLFTTMASVLFGATGCVTKAVDDAEDNYQELDDNVSAKLKKGTHMSESSVSVTDELYVAGDVIRLDEHYTLPDFFNKSVVFNQLDPVSFQEMIGLISNDVNTRISLSSDAIDFLEGKSSSDTKDTKNASNPADTANAPSLEPLITNDIDFSGIGLVGSNLTFSLEHKGTVASLLDTVTSKANLFWKWDKNHIEIFRTETKHFVFDADDATTEFNAQINSSQDAQGGSDGSSGGSSTSMHGTKIATKAVSIYDELETALKSMVSTSGGHYTISRSMGDVSVTDTPRNIERIQSYIEELNNSVDKKIAIRAEVYEIVSDENGDFGIDWSAINKGSSRFSLQMDTAFNKATASNFTLGIIDGNNNYNGTKAFMNMLNKLAQTSLVTSASVFTTNGQSVPVQVADEKNYLKKMSVETDETTGSKTYTMEPGTVMSGFSMSINPRILSDGKVSMRFAVDMSQLNEIVDLRVGDEETGSLIQLPDRTAKNFMQRVTVGSGQTMMISGFERTESNAKTSSLAGKNSWFAGGSRSGGNRKIKTMILLTPYIMAK